MLATVSEEPQKSMSIEEYFKDQEDMIKTMLELKNDITVPTMGEYYQNTYSVLISNIGDTNKINIKNNTIVFKKNETDRIEAQIKILEQELGNYKSEEQYI